MSGNFDISFFLNKTKATERLWGFISTTVKLLECNLITVIIFFYIKAVQCETLVAPANGGFRAVCGNEFSDVCEFQCNDGFNLEGSSSRTCQSNKTWSGTTASCKSKY